MLPHQSWDAEELRAKRGALLRLRKECMVGAGSIPGTEERTWQPPVFSVLLEIKNKLKKKEGSFGAGAGGR